ncbi:MAG: hypothetical protein ACM3UZ_11465 [Acidobacteriota bacterium]
MSDGAGFFGGGIIGGVPWLIMLLIFVLLVWDGLVAGPVAP